MQTKMILLTVDNQKTADYLASKAGITEVRAEFLPRKRQKALRNCKPKTECMIGDGVNDALALKTANVDAAIGSDIAVAAADIAQ